LAMGFSFQVCFWRSIPYDLGQIASYASEKWLKISGNQIKITGLFFPEPGMLR